MSDWRNQPPPAHAEEREQDFRRNLLWIGALHVGAIFAIWLFARTTSAPPRQDVTWLDGGALVQSAETTAASPPATEPETAAPEPEKMEVAPATELPPSEIVLPSVTPQPTEATPSSTPKPTPKPTPKLSPKPTPKSSPKPKPKPSASPKASPKKQSSPKPKPSASPKSEKPSAEDEAKKSAFAATKDGDADKPGTAVGSGGGNRGGAGHAGGGNKESDFGWYHSMIHDRFYSRWEQPTSIISSDRKFIATVKIRIEKDGRISNVSLANPSGNVVMDESVMTAARRVTQIDPLPAGLGGEFYEVKINFELSQQSQ